MGQYLWRGTPGALCLWARSESARYFLAASLCAMAGIGATALAVWGVIPFSNATWHAAEIGMLLEAILLAFALTWQFRVAERRRLHAEELARLDPLTGVNNRRAFSDIATPIRRIAVRHGRDLAVVMLDIDRFKRLNDTFGHAAGDAVLKTVARVLRSMVREQDVIARWGGEEFVVLLPETDRTEAASLAERLRATIAATPTPFGDGELTVTVSLGVACVGKRPDSLEELVTRADRYLYAAKRGGGDRVAVEPDDDPASRGDGQPVAVA